MARILIVDDHPIVRDGLKTYLSLHPDFEVVGETGTVAEAWSLINSQQPDLVLLDIQLPDAGGLTLLPKLRTLDVPPKVLVLTSFLDEDVLREALRLGAAGFLIKHSAPKTLVDGIHAALRGERPLDPEAVGLLAKPYEDPLRDLTPREREVLGHIARGLSNKAIAQALEITEKTVKTHVTHVFSKLNLRDRLQAALYAKDHGL